MKRVVIERGKGSGWETAVGDKYEDLLKIYDSNGNIIYETPNVSTKPSKKFAGGILKEGEYGGVVGLHRNKT
ncbi:MAG: hypothetical protein NZM44_04400, partial [Candidatus Calescibacterium sp.]|nr:hypothetical protein [Candidatus Calescibacterium sp.]